MEKARNKNQLNGLASPHNDHKTSTMVLNRTNLNKLNEDMHSTNNGYNGNNHKSREYSNRNQNKVNILFESYHVNQKTIDVALNLSINFSTVKYSQY
jgi:hypothetical protein